MSEAAETRARLVLAVDDDEHTRNLLRDLCEASGYRVLTASNGEEALAWCSRQVADVLVTDIKLPGRVDGRQIAERCREYDPGLPVIYATGFSPVEARPVPAA